VTDLRDHLDVARKVVVGHPLYDDLTDLHALRIFMDHHVWAVWDFMSLLTELQRRVTCTTVPWVQPAAPATAVRLVNEIVLGEESDDVPGYGITSHVDLYRAAMHEAGASTTPLDAFQAAVRVATLRPLRLAALAGVLGAPLGAERFLAATMAVVQAGTLADIVGAFAFGREQLIPDLFRPLLANPAARLFGVYLERHVLIDAEEHGPAAEHLVDSLLASADRERAYQAGLVALGARSELWSSVQRAIHDARRVGQ
jgi:hypothetical protein